MRELNVWLIVFGLVVALGLICGSAKGLIQIPLPLAVIIGLGVNAVLVLLQHRDKMGEILGHRS
jgi:hypothetical protein